MQQGESLLFLLDSFPTIWTSRDDIQFALNRALKARDITPILIFSEQPPEAIFARFQSGGAVIYVLNYNQRVDYYRGLKKIIRTHNVKIVNIVFFDYFRLVSWFVRLSGVRRIVFTNCSSGVLRARSWKRRLLYLRTKLVTPPITRMIAVSEFIKEIMVQVGVPERKIEVAFTGIDNKRFSPDPRARDEWVKRFEIRHEEIIVSSVAFLRPFKNPQVIIEAAGQLAQRGVPFRLFMAGNGVLRQPLEERSRTLGISNRIHWLGNYPNAAHLLQGSDIFVLASTGEASGLALAEAQACGVPAVGSRSGSIPEVIEDGKTGLLATPLDPGSFADAIERLAGDARLRQDMSRRAPERVQKYFTIDLFVEKNLRIFESVWNN